MCAAPVAVTDDVNNEDATILRFDHVFNEPINGVCKYSVEVKLADKKVVIDDMCYTKADDQEHLFWHLSFIRNASKTHMHMAECLGLYCRDHIESMSLKSLHGQSLIYEYVCRWDVLKAMKMGKRVDVASNPRDAEVSWLYGNMRIDTLIRQVEGTFAQYVCNSEEPMVDSLTRLYVRIGSRSLHVKGDPETIEFNGVVDDASNNQFVLHALSLTYTGSPEVRLAVRQRVHFSETAAERFYSLLKRSELIAQATCPSRRSPSPKRLS